MSARERLWFGVRRTRERITSAVSFEKHLRRSDRPKVLFVVDNNGWAQDFKSRNLARELADEFDCHIVYQRNLRARELRRSDIVVVYYWVQFTNPRMRSLSPVFDEIHDRLALGISDHTTLEGERRDEGLRTLSERPAVVFANSLLLQREYSAALGRKVYYTPNGVDTAMFTPRTGSRPSGRLRVGWAGSLANHGDNRGYHDIIVPAVERLPQVELVTAAREDRKRGHDEMVGFYRDLDVYLCASRTEGTPNPCLEAAACGVGLVSTAVGNMPEFIETGRNGLLVERTVDAFTEVLGRLAEDPDLVASMGAEARGTAIRWDWSVQAEHYREMFRDMLAAAGRVRVRVT